MKVVWSWLLELCELDTVPSMDDVASGLTRLGIEVEGVDPLTPDVDGLVVGEVVSKGKHPNADKLTLVKVTDGSGTFDVVCGAPNVPEAGGKVLWAPPGARLPGGFSIGKRTLKGIESNGMLCSSKELGIGDDHDGIIVLGVDEAVAAPGTNGLAAVGAEDIVLDLSIPANRADALGHLGVARELVAAFGGRLLPWEPDLARFESTDLDARALIDVVIEDPKACPRYIARVIDGVQVGASPRWMQQRLRGVGVRALSDVVDVTNYVMFELGHPLHAFDYASVRDRKIVVRFPRAGETQFVTLDDEVRELSEDTLVIADAETPSALAGVMGGQKSEVSETTSRILLEAAAFEPTGIRRTGKRLGLHSESSHRFERAVDVNGAERASQRAATLIAELTGGRIAQGAVDAYPSPQVPVAVSFSVAGCNRLTGLKLDASEMVATLARLSLTATAVAEGVLSVECPTFRSDLRREVDVYEEVVRVQGFDTITATLPRLSTAPQAPPPSQASVARRALTSAGFNEALTFGFTSPQRIAAMNFGDSDPRGNPVPLANPMSLEQSVMRTSLIPNLLGAVARNLKYGVSDVALFEVGHVFMGPADPLPTEPLHAAGVLCGTRAGRMTERRPSDFFDVKGAVLGLLHEYYDDDAIRFVRTESVGFLHPGIGAVIMAGDKVLGHVGEVHPDTRLGFEIEVPVFAFELTLESSSPVRKMRPIAKFPAVARDISMFVDAELPAQRVRDIVSERAEPLVAAVHVLEEYRDPKRVPEGMKGVLWTITYRSFERTLTDAEVDAAHSPIVSDLLAKLPGTQR